MSKIVLEVEFDGRTVNGERVKQSLEDALVQINRTEHAYQVNRDRARYESNPFPVGWTVEDQPS